MAGAGVGSETTGIFIKGIKPKPKSHQRQEQLFAGLDSSGTAPVAPLFHNSSPRSKNKNSFNSNSWTPRANAGVGVIRAPDWSGEIEEEPHDFPDWRSSRNGSILPAPAALLRSANVGTPRRTRNLCEEAAAAAEESRLDFGAPMEDWSSSLPAPGAAGGGIDKTIYQNLVEMLPLMESFMEQKGGKRPFTRHASMVYTPAPTRETPVKKVAESPMKLKKNKQQRAGNGKIETKEEAPVWEEQENILRRVEQEDCMQQQQQQQYSEAQAVIEKLNREELMQLQDQIDGLKQQLWEKDSMLKTVRSYEMTELANQEEISELKSRVDELQKLLWEKEQVSQTIHTQLLEKQQKCGNAVSLLDRVQQELIRKNEVAAKMREELSELRVKMSEYQFQAELDKAELSQEVGDDLREEDEEDEDDYLLQADEIVSPLKESMILEAARRMYLGAVITARMKPGVESMALAAESRKRLEGFLKHPFLRGASLPLI